MTTCPTCGTSFTAFRASTVQPAKFCSRSCANRAPRTRVLATHCGSGHEFTEENTYRPPRGGRQCRECTRQSQRAFKDLNREKVRAENRAYMNRRYATDPEFAERQRQRARAVDPEARSEARKRSYAKHAEKRRAERRAHYAANRTSDLPIRPRDLGLTDDQMRERRSSMGKAWRNQNREQYRVSKANAQARRSARIKGAERIEKVDRAVVFKRDGGRCHICGRRCAPGAFELDHLIPLSRGGSHTYENVAVSHAHCNRSRGAGRLPAQLRLVG